MNDLRFLRRLAYGALVWLSFGCGPAPDDEEPDGTGGQDGEESECGSDLAIMVAAGTGTGDLFVPLEDGDTLVPYFGSQAGMEVDVSVLLTGLARRDVKSIEVSLNVDGDPIGFDEFSPRDLDCSGGSATIETPVLIDVTDHPTVTSVAQLSGREAQIAVKVSTEDGERTSSVLVVLEI